MFKDTIKLLGDRLLVERDKTEEKIGSIIVPENAKEVPLEGTIIGVGEGKRGEDGKTIQMSVKKGDRVLFGRYSGTEIEKDNTTYLILTESEVIGIL